MTQAPASLADLRRRLDAIDDRLLDQLMERARAMEDVRAAKAAEGKAAEGKAGERGPDVHLARPGRELAILRRLVARIQGPLPPGLVVRLWRDIMTSFTRLQGAFSVVVLDIPGDERAKPAAQLMGLARRHYGQATPLLAASSPAQLFARLEDGRAQLGLLPTPEDTPDLNWWRNLAPGGLQVLARLPIDGRETQPGAFVVGRQRFEESGGDRGLLAVAPDIEASRAKVVRLLTEAGFSPVGIIAETLANDRPLFLIVNEAYVAPGDARLASLADAGVRTCVAGGYGVPLDLALDQPLKGVPA
jgi:chorismate mutase